VTGGTGTRAAVPAQTVFGKTGTTDDRSDAWFVGATQNLATAVWFGNRISVVPGAGFGGNSSAPTFREFMTGALDGLADPGLPPPGPVCARAGQYVEPNGGRGFAPVAPPPVIEERPAPTEQTAPPTVPPPTDATRPTTTEPKGDGDKQ
jgi:membrane peptidoglycan carboxypeptidase